MKVNGSAPASCATLTGNVSNVYMTQVWVQATTSTGAKLYDPSYKTYVQKTGIDIAAAMGCGNATSSTCGSTANTVAIPSGLDHQGTETLGSKNVRYVKKLDYSGLGTTLNGFAASLQHYVEANMPSAQVEDVVGGRVIDMSAMPVPGTTLPYASAQTEKHSWDENGDIPDPYRSRLHIQFDQIDVWLFADETYGYWLYVGGEYGCTADYNCQTRYSTLFLERERGSDFPLTPNVFASCHAGQTGCTGSPAKIATNEFVPLANSTVPLNGGVTVTIQADHPYAAAALGSQTLGTYADDTFTDSFNDSRGFPFNSGSPNVYSTYILQSWGRSGRGNAARMSAMAGDKQDNVWGPSRCLFGSALPIPSNLCEAILVNTSIPGTAAAWLGEAGKATALADGVNKSQSQEHHTIGLVLDESFSSGTNDVSTHIDAATGLGVASKGAAATDTQAAFVTDATVYDAFEGSATEQATDNVDGANVIRWFEMTNYLANLSQSVDNPIYDVNGDNYQDVLAATNCRSPATVTSYALASNPSFSMMFPKYCTLPLGKGEFMLAYAADTSALAYVAQGGDYGADAAITAPDPVAAAQDTARKTQPTKPLSFAVDNATGALSATPAPDLVIGAGGFPSSLSYQRTYNSKGNASFPCVSKMSIPSPLTYSWVCMDPPTRREMLGWDDNLQIDASFANDGMRCLGEDSALDASSAIAALYVLRDLGRPPTQPDMFHYYATSMLTAAWLEDAFGANAVVVSRPPASETFVRLPDGRFNARPGSQAKLTQSGARARTYAITHFGGSPTFSYDYANTAFTETFSDGSALNFVNNDSVSTTSEFPYIPILNRFKPVDWAFPGGMDVGFAYTGISDPTTVVYSGDHHQSEMHHALAVMTGVSNSLGHSLSFVADGGATNDPDGYTVGTRVSDETGRNVYVRSNNSLRGATGMKVIGADSYKTLWALDRADIFRGNMAARLSKVYLPLDWVHPYLTFDYDGLRRVKDVVDGVGHATTYFPGSVGATENVVRGMTKDASNYVSMGYFDDKGHPLSSTDPLGNTTTYQYDGLGRLVLTTYPEGNSTALTYDVRSNVLTTARHAKPGCTPLPQCGDIATSTAYVAGPTVLTCTNMMTCNKPDYATNARSFVTDYGWDPLTGLLKSIKRGLNASFACQVGSTCPETDLDYAACGNVDFLTQKTDIIAAGQSTVTKYDYGSTSACHLTTATVDFGGLSLATQFGFDTHGDLTSVDGPRSDVTDNTKYVWDVDRRLSYSIQADPDGTGPHNRPATRYLYDQNGNRTNSDVGITTTNDQTGFASQLAIVTSYDAAQRKIKEATPTRLTQYSYTFNGMPQCVTVRMSRDSNNHFVNPPSGACTLGDADDQTGYGADRITQFFYDGNHHKTKEMHAVHDGDVTYAVYHYTPNGQQDWVYDALGATHKMLYAYDGFDRLSRTTYPLGTFEQLTYDADGNVQSRTNRGGQNLTYGYDPLDEMVVKSVPAYGSHAANTVTWTYDLAGQVSVVSDSLNNRLTNCYDKAGRLTRATASTSNAAFDCVNDAAAHTSTTRTVTYAYDNGAGDPVNRSKLTWPDGYYVSYGYDALSHMLGACENGAYTVSSGACTGAGSAKLAAYNYDEMARRSGTQYGAGALAASIFLSRSTENDLLTLVHNLAGTANDVTFNDQYSPAQQIVLSTLDNTAYLYTPGTYTRAYGTVNKLNQYPTVALNGGTPVAITYDNNGNLTGDGTWTYSYDPENRLVSAAGPGVSAAYSYDPLGRRNAKSGAGVAATKFLDSGDDEIAEYDGGGTLLRRFVPGAGVDDYIAMVTPAGGKSYFHQDKTGSVVAMSDASGNIAEGPYAYDPYGNGASASGVPFKYTGRRLDPETGLYYYRARYYAPAIGRFVQTDPTGYQDDLNWYAYVKDDPANNNDPTGKDCLSAAGTTTCTTTEYIVSFPTPPGWHDFTSKSPHYHKYNTPAHAPAGWSLSQTRTWLRETPTPGFPQPATAKGAVNDATPGVGGISPINISPVMSFTGTNARDGNEVAINVTLTGHPLQDGVVVREVVPDQAGVLIKTTGEGTAVLQAEDSDVGKETGPFINGVWGWPGQAPPTQEQQACRESPATCSVMNGYRY